MMKKIFYLIFIAVTALSFQSCSKDDDSDNSAWRTENEAAFNKIAVDPSYTAVSIDGLQGTIYRKAIKSPSIKGDTAIIGSSVKVLYTGRLIDGTIFDTTDGTGDPRSFTLTNNSVIKGWMIALQHMTPGDKWEVWIPWTLGYSDKGSGVIAPYSTLIFDIEIVSVNKYPK